MIVKITKNLENKMGKRQESINKDLEELKNKLNLINPFNSFTFKVIIDIHVPITIFLIVWG